MAVTLLEKVRCVCLISVPFLSILNLLFLGCEKYEMFFVALCAAFILPALRQFFLSSCENSSFFLDSVQNSMVY